MVQILIEQNTSRVVGVSNEKELREGWVEVQLYPDPGRKEGYNPVPYYRDGKIVYEYEEAIPDLPEEQPIPEIPYEEQVVAKIRERYSIDDELAILRQRYTKPDEFEAYNAYAESCKEEARLLIEKQNK